jgi:cytochrome c553
MKKIFLSAAVVLFAATSVFAGPTPAKKAKQATCTSCHKDKCTSKATCPKVTVNCVCS